MNESHTSTTDDIASSDETDSSPSALTATIACDAPDAPERSWLIEKLDRIVERLAAEIACVNVIVVDDSTMTDIHKRYMDRDASTDVLSFDLSDAPGGPTEGEIYVCLDEARRCAERFGHPLSHELLLYAVHGLLHLMGYDDSDAVSFAQIHEKEDELLREIGVGNVFRQSTRGETS